MQNDESRPEKDQVEQANQSEEQRHVHTILILHSFLHHHGVGSVQYGRDQGNNVACGADISILAAMTTLKTEKMKKFIPMAICR